MPPDNSSLEEIDSVEWVEIKDDGRSLPCCEYDYNPEGFEDTDDLAYWDEWGDWEYNK